MNKGTKEAKILRPSRTCCIPAPPSWPAYEAAGGPAHPPTQHAPHGGPFGDPLQFTAPELHAESNNQQVGMVHEGNARVRGYPLPMPTEPSFVYKVLAGAVQARRGAFHVTWFTFEAEQKRRRATGVRCGVRAPPSMSVSLPDTGFPARSEQGGLFGDRVNVRQGFSHNSQGVCAVSFIHLR